jgi:hypothetical protein
MDGKPLLERLEGTAVLVDPGEHRFVFDAEGLQPVEKTVVVRVAEKDRLVTVVLAPRPAASAQASPPAAVGAPPPASPAPVPRAPAPAPAAAPESPGVPAPAWASFGLGAAGLVAAGVFTALWLQAKHDGDAACGTAGACDGPTASGWEGKQQGYTVGLVAGLGVAVAGAGLGLLLLPSGHKVDAVSWRRLEIRF